MSLWKVSLLPVLLLLSAAAGAGQERAKPKEAKAAAEQKSIGTATMTPDGVIILDLRSDWHIASKSEARYVYPPNHKRYAEVLQHLGGLKPGEKKPVAPWPQKEKAQEKER